MQQQRPPPLSVILITINTFVPILSASLVVLAVARTHTSVREDHVQFDVNPSFLLRSSAPLTLHTIDSRTVSGTETTMMNMVIMSETI